jgi:capsular exopolysaccharide synthesis family protein
MAPLGYLKVVRQRWLVVLACFLVAATIGYILAPEPTAVPRGSGYQASLTLVPPFDATTGTNLHLAAHLVTTPDVANLAAAKLPADLGPANTEAITATVSSAVGSLTITATDLDETTAGVLAEAYAAATIEFLQATFARSDEAALAAAQEELAAIEKGIRALEREIGDEPEDEVLRTRLDTELTRYSIVFQRVQDILSADEAAAPLQVLGTPQVTPLEIGGISAPTDPLGRGLLAGALGLVLGLGVALAVHRLDTRLRERDDVEEAFGLPVLGEIPRTSRRARADHALVTADQPNSVAAEAYRSLRSAITLVAQSRLTDGGASSVRAAQQTPQVIVVAGARGDEGKSTTVVNLAAALAETGRSVLVIDCDFRKPEAHFFLDAPSGLGLADLVEADLSESLDQIIRPTAIPGVHLVSSGKPVSHPVGVLARLSGVIAEVRNRADVVLIDSSPLLATSEALDVLQYADAALVACRLGRTTQEQARRARKLLHRAEVPVLGVVLTGTTPHRGTPYGQPSRRQAFWSRLWAWAQSAGPNPGWREPPEEDVDVARDWAPGHRAKPPVRSLGSEEEAEEAVWSGGISRSEGADR